MRALTAFSLFFLLALASPAAAAPAGFEIAWPKKRLFVGAAVDGLQLRAVDSEGRTDRSFEGWVEIEGLSQTASISLSQGTIKLGPNQITKETVSISAGGVRSEREVPILIGWLSLLPALLAIGLALLTRQVLLSLFGGVWLGASLLGAGPIGGFFGSLSIAVEVLADSDRAKIVIFTLLMGGMVGVVGASGGSSGIVAALSRYATSPRSGSIATWAMGMLIFFDDYASSLLVGSTMRPVTDRLRISREKLSYIVDSTAAPITSLAAVSTWVGYEVSVLGDAMRASGLARDPYEVFLSGMPSRFYQIFALAFVVMVALIGRDFGPMLTAERRARKEGKPLRDGATPLMDATLIERKDEAQLEQGRWWLAVVPISVLILGVLYVLVTTGLAAGDADPDAFSEAKAGGVMRTIGFILSNAASYDALLFASGVSAVVALVLSLGVRALSLGGAIDAFINGVRAMTLAVIVLCLAWSIGKVMSDLEAGAYVAGLIGDSVPLWSLPTITFLLGAIIAVSTGTSWGTIAILFPIAIPVVALHQADPSFDALLLGTSSAILGGAVFGDHCSPISDTTVLSSIACAADHVDHTRTQAPYAIVTGMVSLGLGYLPIGFGMSPWIAIALGLVALAGTLYVFGRRPEA